MKTNLELGLLGVLAFLTMLVWPTESKLNGQVSRGGSLPPVIKVMSSNYAFDLLGPMDNRPGTWGQAASYTHAMEFTPPTNQSVMVHSISGDIVAWVRTQTQGKFGVLFGFQQYPENRGGGGECDWCDITTMLYGQAGANSKDVITRTFSQRYTQPVVLPENKLYVKGASWLNDTGQAVHFEITFTVEYEFREQRYVPKAIK